MMNQLKRIYHTGLCMWAVLGVYQVYTILSRKATDDGQQRIRGKVNRISPDIYNTESLEHQTLKPFSEGQAHLVLVLSYQRCGSSFFGGLFDQDSHSLYLYEPVDGLYGAMYGTPEGWNVPADIMNWPNGSQRVIPKHESRIVSDFLADLLNCRISSLPVEFLLHNYWNMFSGFETKLAPYIKCLRHNKQVRAHALCHRYIKKHCPSRFGINANKQDMCHNMLWHTDSIIPRKRSDHIASFFRYKNCMREQLRKAQNCMVKLTDVCKESQLRSTKTVRVTMQSVESLVRQNSNLRVIHLMRDPRAVVTSRNSFGRSGQSLYARESVQDEAKLFCHNLVSDVKLRHQLELRYPGTFMEVLYDDFVLDPINYTRKIYKFIGMNLTEKVKKWVKVNTQTRRKNSTAIAAKWQSKLTFYEATKITEYCKDFFDLVKNDLTT